MCFLTKKKKEVQTKNKAENQCLGLCGEIKILFSTDELISFSFYIFYTQFLANHTHYDATHTYMIESPIDVCTHRYFHEGSSFEF